MRAWRLDQPGGAFHLEDMPRPTIRPGGVLVRIEASTMMSYMKAYVDGHLPGYQAPEGAFTPGGNGIGVIEGVGADVWQLHVGQRVAVSPLYMSAENVADPAPILIGVTSFDADSAKVQASWRDGTLAEYALLPAASVVPIDPGLANYDAVTLALASRFVVPYGGLARGRLAPGETLVVNGATGAYGTAAVLLAAAMGAGRIVAAGRDTAKLTALASIVGPVLKPVTLTGNRETDAAALRNAAEGSAQIAFDMVGGATDPSSTLAALDALGRCGRLVLMGSMSTDLPLSYLQLMLRSLEVIGNFMHPPEAYRTIFALVLSGRLDLNAVKACEYPLEDAPSAMLKAQAASNLEAVVIRSSVSTYPPPGQIVKTSAFSGKGQVSAG